MSGPNTHKEHLQYNEKERNVKSIVFDPCQLFDPYKTFMRPTHTSHANHAKILTKFYRSTLLTPKFRHTQFFLTRAKIF